MILDAKLASEIKAPKGRRAGGGGGLDLIFLLGGLGKMKKMKIDEV